MGAEFQVDSLEAMCDLMCNNTIPKEAKGMKNDQNRNQEIYALRLGGMKYQQIADRFGITKIRARAICIQEEQNQVLYRFKGLSLDSARRLYRNCMLDLGDDFPVSAVYDLLSHKGASAWEIGEKTLAELSDFFGQEVVRVGDRIKFKN